jgi:uracil-DNA glycosylase family 4
MRKQCWSASSLATRKTLPANRSWDRRGRCSTARWKKACRQWYERELAAIKPDLVVAMGATAAQSVFGKITPINKNRGRLLDLDDGIKALVTVHPSYLLRLPDAAAKARETSALSMI